MPEETVLPWNGEGPPPTGTVCEVDGSAGETGFATCTINYSSNDVIVWQYLGSDVEHCAYVGAREFRPNGATAEQHRQNLARELFETMIPAESRCLSWEGIHENGRLDFLRAIDAGYRKQVQP
ncbi:hypothetical protein [Pseudomonas atagonensis]|uniref:hypothetical protein n=1 Tax=Pseudomonas atagonensis TaxID=2609964 RepID=UPI00140914CA|nr:hypothetical protein [Pseudomonas atagonensis]